MSLARPTLSSFVRAAAPSQVLRASARHRRRARDGASAAGLANTSQAWRDRARTTRHARTRPPCPCPAQRGTPAPATVRPWGRWCPSAHNVSRPHLQLCTRAERSAYPRKLLVLPPQSQQHGLGRCRLSCNCMDMLVLEQVTTAPRRQARGGHVACTPAAGRVRDLSTEVRRIFFLKNLCYEVFAKQKKTEESSNNY